MAKNIFNNLIFETTKTISFCLVAYVEKTAEAVTAKTAMLLQF